MTRSRWILAVVTAALVAGGALASAAAEKKAGSYGKKKPSYKTVTITKGDDCWTTPGGGGTKLDLAGFPVKKIFGAPLTGSTKVSLKSKPLSPELGDCDTIIRRPEDIVIKGGKGSGPLEIAVLSLGSEKPVSIGGKNYDLEVGLSEIADARPGYGPKPGRATLTLTHGDGGTFSSSLPVQPRLVFRPEGGGQAVTIDCSAFPSCASGGQDFVLSGKGIPWSFTGGPRNLTPDAANIRPIKAGVTVGAEGFRRYTTTGSSNLLAGVSSSSPTLARPGNIETSRWIAHRVLAF